MKEEKEEEKEEEEKEEKKGGKEKDKLWEKEEGGRAGEIVEEGGLSRSLFQNLDYKLPVLQMMSPPGSLILHQSRR